jgi:ribulose-phosphate 3-epimerase
MSVNPGFGGQRFIPYSVNKIRRLKELRQELGLSYRIEVDGGVAHDTVASVVEAGADLLVAGNAVFGEGHAERDARKLLKAALQTQRSPSKDQRGNSGSGSSQTAPRRRTGTGKRLR